MAGGWTEIFAMRLTDARIHGRPTRRRSWFPTARIRLKADYKHDGRARAWNHAANLDSAPRVRQRLSMSVSPGSCFRLALASERPHQIVGAINSRVSRRRLEKDACCRILFSHA